MALEKVERVEYGPVLGIMEVTGYRPGRRSRELVDSLSPLSISMRIHGIMLGKALNLGPS